MKSCNSFFITSLFSVISLVTSSFAYAGTPVVNNGLASESFAGEQVCFDAQFSNTSATVGYGPYIRLELPSNITFDSATFLGVAVETTAVGVFYKKNNFMVSLNLVMLICFLFNINHRKIFQSQLCQVRTSASRGISARYRFRFGYRAAPHRHRSVGRCVRHPARTPCRLHLR